jgi:hypothetical protein
MPIVLLRGKQIFGTPLLQGTLSKSKVVFDLREEILVGFIQGP